MTRRKPSRSSRCSAATVGGISGEKCVVGAAQGDGGVAPVRGHDDEIRIVPSANSNDLDTLAPKGMMRMGDGHKSRSWSG